MTEIPTTYCEGSKDYEAQCAVAGCSCPAADRRQAEIESLETGERHMVAVDLCQAHDYGHMRRYLHTGDLMLRVA